MIGRTVNWCLGPAWWTITLCVIAAGLVLVLAGTPFGREAFGDEGGDCPYCSPECVCCAGECVCPP
jgi:hypothetical protein